MDQCVYVATLSLSLYNVGKLEPFHIILSNIPLVVAIILFDIDCIYYSFVSCVRPDVLWSVFIISRKCV